MARLLVVTEGYDHAALDCVALSYQEGAVKQLISSIQFAEHHSA